MIKLFFRDRERWRQAVQLVKAAVIRPSERQKHAWGGLFLAIAAAALIGSVTVLYTEVGFSWEAAWRITGLVVSGIWLSVVGVVLSK